MPKVVVERKVMSMEKRLAVKGVRMAETHAVRQCRRNEQSCCNDSNSR
jgi:hypothetical protein